MKTIALNRGLYALVDDEDYEQVNPWKWFATESSKGKIYVARVFYKNNHPSKVYLHRFIMKPPKGFVVDHINHDTLDNRRVNLRICKQTHNLHNSGKPKNNTSGYKGVYLHKKTGLWFGSITVKGKKHNVGYFKNPGHAALAVDLWTVDLYGEHGYTNFPVVTYKREGTPNSAQG